MVCLFHHESILLHLERMILMELLLMVGMIVKGVTYGGYGLAGLYFAKTAVRYVQDYKEAVSNERG